MAKSHSHRSPSQVRVILRVRPFLPSEIDSNNSKNPVPCITVLNPDHHSGEEVTVRLKDPYTSRNECYKLDSFFGQDGHVDRIFDSEVSAVIPGIFQGLNATVFAYGATGSGKTYTMQGTDDEPGLIPLAVSAILSLCKNTQSSPEISYYEVYMDRCYDLLEPKAKEIMALDDKDGRVQLKGLSWVPVQSMDEFCEVFSTGVQRRKVAHTGLNDVSSRSHGVLAISVTNGDLKGKLNLIDLAGNEDNRRTCNEGIRLQESAKINQSLFALSNVISALNNNETRIPYRESKLTRILQDSLGGTSRALMIACLNPGLYQEAVHTVSLAARSRQVVNVLGSAKKETPTVKIDMEEKLRAWLESKGKNRSIQRINGTLSPFLGRTPTSVNCVKKPGSVQSSIKAKIMDKAVVGTNGRKLFESGAPDSDMMEENLPPSVAPSIEAPQPNQETRPCNLDIDIVQHDNMLHGASSVSYEDCSQIDKHALHDLDQCEQNENVQFSIHRSDDNDGQRSATDFNISQPSYFPGTQSNKENLHSLVKGLGSPPISERIQELRHSIRNVLSPVASNRKPINHLSSDERICVIMLEPETPKPPSVLTCDKYEEQVTGTPLDKFNALSSNVKESLIQEYLAVLNVASKEELLQLKGIGKKRAEYILELREHTPRPLKSLSDLEKIGLSSKQVHDMFRRVARGIF